MSELSEGLIAAFVLDGKGGGRRLNWDEMLAWEPGDGFLWVHLDYEAYQPIKWLRLESGLGSITLEALLAHDPRPRSLVHGDGMIAVIRGVNSEKGAAPEDMVSLRAWVETGRAITLRHRKYLPTKNLREQIENGTGPAGASDFLHRLYDLSLAPLTVLVDKLDADVDELEDDVLRGDEGDVRHKIGLVRRASIILRRHVGPQRSALNAIKMHNVSWLTETDRLNLAEAAEAQARIIEELDSARERAAVTAEELAGRLSELMDRRLYVLSMIAAISLPLGILTGLLGVNVGGVPLEGNAYGFIIICAALSALTFLQVYLFRKLSWL